MPKLTSLGELLVDFTPVDENTYQYNPGGGPANMACMAAKLSTPAAFIGQVGDDAFGRRLYAKLLSENLDVEALKLSKDYPTTLSFVHWAAGGERSFSFYRHHNADTQISVTPEARQKIEASEVFYESSVLMAEGPSRETSFELMQFAKSKGVTIAFDPNLRFNLWESEEELKQVVLKALAYPSLAKMSEEEILFLSGRQEMDEAIRWMFETYANIALLLVTLGPDGAIGAFADDRQAMVPSIEVEAVDTTGAGDAFTGAFLSCLIQTGKKPADLSMDELTEMIRFANVAGALTTTGKGGIDAQPSREQILRFL